MSVLTSPPVAMNGVSCVRPEPPPRLEVFNISKRFGAVQALTDVSMKLEPGSFRALLGENGAGKSTLVKCVMGLTATHTGWLANRRRYRSPQPRQVRMAGLGMVYSTSPLMHDRGRECQMGARRAACPLERRKEAFRHPCFRASILSSVTSGAGEKGKVEILK